MVHSLTLAALLTLVVLAVTPVATVTVASAEAARAVTAPNNDRVNINTAGLKELMSLSGVGRSLAEKIVKYRDEHGLFRKPADLRKVEGVGAALWEKNRERIVVK